MSQNENKTITLYPDIGYHILNFLEGIYACDFLEVVNDVDQFLSIATATHYIFFNLIKEIFSCGDVIKLPIEIVDNYIHDY